METLEALLQATVMVGGISAITLGFQFRRELWSALKQAAKDAANEHSFYDEWRDR